MRISGRSGTRRPAQAVFDQLLIRQIAVISLHRLAQETRLMDVLAKMRKLLSCRELYTTRVSDQFSPATLSQCPCPLVSFLRVKSDRLMNLRAVQLGCHQRVRRGQIYCQFASTTSESLRVPNPHALATVVSRSRFAATMAAPCIQDDTVIGGYNI